MKKKIRKNKALGRRRAAFPTRFIVCGILILLQILLTFSLASALGETFIYSQVLSTIFSVAVLLYMLNKDEPAAHKLAWAVVLTVLPVFGAIIYCMFGNPQQTRKAKKRFSAVNKEAALFLKSDELTMKKLEETSEEGASLAKYLDKVCNIPPYKNSGSKYYPSGEAFFADLLSDIEKAKRYIFLEYFIITPGEIWNKIHNALVNRAMAGVDVYIMYDDIGSMKKTPAKFDAEIRKEGINCFKFNKISPIPTTLHNNRDHRKIAVIDGKIAYIGGVNIADEYANIEKPFGHWKDSAIRISGEAVDGFVFMFTQLYNIFATEPLDPADFLATHEHIADDGFIQPYGDGPKPMYNDYIGKNLYLGIINSAKKYLYIATPYLICGYEVEEAMIFAAKRGVDVRIITPHIPDKKAVFTMTRSSYAKLIDGGVKIYEYAPGFIHSKMVVADDELAVIGTVNFDYRSFVHHYECGTLICKAACIKDIKEDVLSTCLKEGIMQTKESAKLNFGEKIVKTVCGLFTPML